MLIVFRCGMQTQAYYAYLLGRSYLVSGEAAKARKEFEKAVAADPEFTLAVQALEGLRE